MFVHIPKTGGLAIRRFLQRNKMNQWNRDFIYTFHDPLFYLETINDLSNTFIFSVVRNPFTRIYSHYMHARNVKKVNLTFTELLKYIRLSGNVFLTDMHYRALPLAPYNQSFYLHNNNGQMAINKIYRYEQLSEFEVDFNTKLETVNVGNYTRADYLANYTQQNVNLVKQLYFEDFIRFNYSNSFDDSIGLVKEQQLPAAP